uniref:Uncharacterized protein n=1 Tax=Arundo donax TaxID=35708 RepID=A0A0A8YMD0_ARUDO
MCNRRAWFLPMEVQKQDRMVHWTFGFKYTLTHIRICISLNWLY